MFHAKISIIFIKTASFIDGFFPYLCNHNLIEPRLWPVPDLAYYTVLPGQQILKSLHTRDHHSALGTGLWLLPQNKCVGLPQVHSGLYWADHLLIKATVKDHQRFCLINNQKSWQYRESTAPIGNITANYRHQNSFPQAVWHGMCHQGCKWDWVPSQQHEQGE
jgi:hypothetical protein